MTPSRPCSFGHRVGRRRSRARRPPGAPRCPRPSRARRPDRSWFAETLGASPANSSQKVDQKTSAACRFQTLASTLGSANKAAALFRNAPRARSLRGLPRADAEPARLDALQAGGADDATGLFRLNVEANPASANAYDSLADDYLARGRSDLSLAAEQKCLEMLPDDTIDDGSWRSLRRVAEERNRELNPRKSVEIRAS